MRHLPETSPLLTLHQLPSTGPCGFARVFHGVYAPVDAAGTLPTRAAAALLLAPDGAALARHTAARLWGGVVPPCPTSTGP